MSSVKVLRPLLQIHFILTKFSNSDLMFAIPHSLHLLDMSVFFKIKFVMYTVWCKSFGLT